MAVPHPRVYWGETGNVMGGRCSRCHLGIEETVPTRYNFVPKIRMAGAGLSIFRRPGWRCRRGWSMWHSFCGPGIFAMTYCRGRG